MNETILALLFLSTTESLELPHGLLSALCFVESRHIPHAIHKDDGPEDSVGICQLHLSTAKMMGFTGTEKALLNPKVNIKYAGLYLKHQLDRYPLNETCGVAAYNSGSCRFDKKRQIRNFKYVKKVYAAWAGGK